MAQLPKDVAEETAKAETGFALMEEDRYTLELIEVQTEDKDGKPIVGKDSGIPYWKFVFQVPEDAERYKKRRFWVNFSHSEKAAPIRKQLLDALGVSADTDTDDMIGLTADAHIWSVKIEQGAKAGEDKDDIKFWYKRDDAPVDKGAGASSKPKKDMF